MSKDAIRATIEARPAACTCPVVMRAGRFTGRALAPDQVTQAFPLLALADSVMGIEQWRRLAQAVLADTTPPPSGIMTLQDDHGYIHALFRYRVVAEACRAPTLRVDDLVAADQLDRAVSRSVVALLDGMARAYRCAEVDISLPLPGTRAGEEPELQRRLRGEGFAMRSRSLRKPVDDGG